MQTTDHPPRTSDASGNGVRILRNEHATLAAMLQSILLMVERGPHGEPERFFDVLRAMLFYIDEFPERLHHPKESQILFPAVARLAPEVAPTLEKLERDHAHGEVLVRSLQHDLTAWEMVGDSRRAAFERAAREYVAFYLEHMRLEETVILPAAAAALTAADWATVDAAFEQNRDPFAKSAPEPAGIYDRMFTKIVTYAPAPIGVGRS